MGISLLNLGLILVLYRQFGLSAMASAAGHDNDGVPVGEVAPPLLLRPNETETDLVEVSAGGRWSIVLFATPHCEPCVMAMTTLDQARSRLPDQVRVVAALNWISGMPVGQGDIQSHEYDVLLDPDGATMGAWQVKVTPFVMLLDPDRKVRNKALASTEKRIQAFLDSADDLIGRESPVSAFATERLGADR